jgi:hypothetical protein
MSRLPVAEAARILGITSDAVRARIRRGKIEAEQVGHAWYVFLPTSDVATVDATTTRQERDTVAPQSRHGPDSANDAVIAAKDEVIRRQDQQIEYLQAELAKRSAELATERERSDVLQQLALSRIPAVTAGVVQEPPSDAPQAPGAPIEPPMANDLFMANGAVQTPSEFSDELTAEWADLTEQLIAELAMDPRAAMLAAAAELGIPYGDESAAGS